MLSGFGFKKLKKPVFSDAIFSINNNKKLIKSIFYEKLQFLSIYLFINQNCNIDCNASINAFLKAEFTEIHLKYLKRFSESYSETGSYYITLYNTA